MPRVLFLTNTISEGGPLRVLLRQTGALQRRGYDCEVWGLSGSDGAAKTEVDVPQRSLGLPKGSLLLGTSRRLAAELERARPDALHIHSYSAHAHGVRAAHWLGLKPVVVSFHDLRLRPTHVWTCRALRRRLDQVIVLNETMRALYQRRCGYTDQQLFTLPNAVDTARFSPRPRDPELAAQLGLRPEECVIGCVGNFHPNKAQRVLVEAFSALARELPAARLVLVGDGRKRREVERQVARQGLAERVTMAGAQPEIARWLSLFDLYVQPSLIEADPLAVHEAMAMGLPIVATARGGCPELLAQGAAGRLVPPGDPAALAAALRDLVADRRQAAALGEAARRRAVEHYDLRAYEERFAELYARLLPRAGS